MISRTFWYKSWCSINNDLHEKFLFRISYLHNVYQWSLLIFGNVNVCWACYFCNSASLPFAIPYCNMRFVMKNFDVRFYRHILSSINFFCLVYIFRINLILKFVSRFLFEDWCFYNFFFNYIISYRKVASDWRFWISTNNVIYIF